MIIVTGTKRSGTSMWMQVLRESGITVHGEAFPKRWEQTIKDANPHGFYESPLRRGIYYATNPDPRTGAFVSPARSKQLAVKVFVPGLIRSDLAYVDFVIATVRRCSEYTQSSNRLYTLENEGLAVLTNNERHVPVRVPAHLEWWLDNFMLLRDAAIRGYKIQMVTYDQVLADPESIVPRVLRWVGAPNPAAGSASVKPQTRTQRSDSNMSGLDDVLTPAQQQTFDELYDTIHEQKPLVPAFLARLNEVNQELQPQIVAARNAVREDRRLHPRKRLNIQSPADEIEELVHNDESDE